MKFSRYFRADVCVGTSFVGTVLLWLAVSPPAFGDDTLVPGDEFKDCPQCPVMVVVPSGETRIGTPPVDQGRPYSEGRRREVRVNDPFAMGKFEVTFDEWDACVNEGACANAQDDGLGRGKRPVINISWTEADAYTRWLKRKTGKTYRIPTEAEWEYSARAGADAERFFGLRKEDVCKFGNVYDETAQRELDFGWDHLPCDDGFAETAPAGSFSPNAFGLHDMLGNVWEWTLDCRVKLWQHAPADTSPRLDGDCSERAFRGASWVNHPPWYLRSGDRYKFVGARYNDLGFRVARDLK